MSIMSEYEDFRKELGEREFRLLEKFLEENEQYLLSDLYYSQAAYSEYEKWRAGYKKECL